MMMNVTLEGPAATSDSSRQVARAPCKNLGHLEDSAFFCRETCFLGGKQIRRPYIAQDPPKKTKAGLPSTGISPTRVSSSGEFRT